MKFSLSLTVILSHSFLVALAGSLPLFQPAVIALLVLEAAGIILFCHRCDYSPLSLACLVGLSIALVAGV